MQQTWAVFANGTQVRVFWVDGEPLFDAMGVCEAVGLRNVEKALRRLDDDEQGSVILEGLDGREEIHVVRESGMLRLSLVGKDEHARALQRWATREVLPSVIRTGRYGEPDIEQEQLQLQKATLLFNTLAMFRDRLFDETVQNLANAIADVLRG